MVNEETVSDRARVVLAGTEALSVTFTVKLDVLAADGVPLITPLLDSARPEGNEPESIDHVYEGVPPVAARGAE